MKIPEAFINLLKKPEEESVIARIDSEPRVLPQVPKIALEPELLPSPSQMTEVLPSPSSQNLFTPLPPPSEALSASAQEQARKEIGSQKRRGFGGVLKDALLGLATGGVGGAIVGGIKGGDIRYRNNVADRAAEIEQQRAAEIANKKMQMEQDRLQQDGLYQQKQIENMEFDNQLAQQQAVAEEENKKKRLILETAQTLKNTGQALTDEVADFLQLPRGTILASEANPNGRYSVDVDFTTGQAVVKDKQTGDIRVIDSKQSGITPRPRTLSASSIEAEVRSKTLSSIKQTPNVPSGYTWSLLAQDLAKRSGLDLTKAEDAEKLKRKFEALNPGKTPYTAMTDTEEFKRAYDNNLVNYNQSSSKPSHSKPSQPQKFSSQEISERETRLASRLKQLQQEAESADPSMKQKYETEIKTVEKYLERISRMKADVR